MSEITRILERMDQGDPSAAEQLLPLVYDELRQVAAARLRNENPGLTLQATALVHEAYIRLVNVREKQQWNSRGHFFAAAAEAMRRLLIESARRKKAGKHGGGMQRVTIDAVEVSGPGDDDEILALDIALQKLEKLDKQKAELVKLRFFAGLSNLQAAGVLGIGKSTADRHWAFARCWLRAEISGLREKDDIPK